MRRRSMSRAESRTVYKRSVDRVHRKNLLSGLDQRGGIRL